MRTPEEDREIEAAVWAMLAAEARDDVPIVGIERRPSQYRTSFALEEITVRRADGRTQALILKDLGWHSLTPAGRQAKPAFLYDPMREIEVYRRVLAGRSLGTAECYGAVVDPPRDRYWLLLEKAPGAELYQHELEGWLEAARWLGQMHGDEALAAAAREIAPRLLIHDAAFYRRWIDRAVKFAPGRFGEAAAAKLRAIAARYDRVAEYLASLPATFLHGEFYASNVLVAPAGGACRVCPVDWELAGIGPGVVDLAALVVGNWTNTERAALVDAYLSGTAASSRVVSCRVVSSAAQTHQQSEQPAAASSALDLALKHARLHLAVQWLGWSPDWSPPAEHAHDWLDEALGLAADIGLINS